ncbi:uncharacterized protein LACBIDRAFT_313149 [Laccaria bicolor S238N-H82]|uniref:Predicted protein n=1 Tax=Laccaria bicolor (strain S238N-H82 / ATCC MYA-4686) TaxID=486041 RepID=B0DXM8_LACBS|nr:uncharacterized protein LACBIDRAFT_313149 [Laccaria bicolor S238N-H82]EDR00709.1 predicted protein [Laccaria bicolor S238N-H82]|eukprot:XP_001888718.1 predicted protein [Laccaria bicolor S238N-H82]
MLLSLLLAYSAGAAPASALIGRSLERRGPQTAAVCSTDFTWADNSKGVSPCLLAAVVLGACQGGNWNVPALVNPTDMYTNPNSSTANVCTCSWLAYNLLGACADCQGFPQAVQNEAPYFQSCQGFTTTTNSYFPSNFSLPEGTLIPYWATYDPSTWPSQHFDATTAKSIAQQEHPDVSNSPTPSSKKKTPIGAIVGGVVGGVVVIALAVGIGLYICTRRRRTPKQQPVSPPLTMGQSAHFRSPSDMTMASTGSLGYTTLSSSPAHPVERSGTVRTHNTSAHSLSYFSSPVSTVPHTTLPTPRQTSPNPSNPEDIIVPFHIPPGGLTNPTLGDRKNPNGSYPVYDAPTAPPISIQSRTEPSIGSSRRARVNPPAYSATDSPSPPPRAQRGLLRQGSTDTHLTYASGTQNNGGYTGNDSSMTSSDIRIPETPVAASGRVVGGPSRDAKRRPTMDNDNVSSVDPRDIA